MNFVDPTGHIEEGQAKTAFDIMMRLKKYNATIVVDWGYKNNGIPIGLLPIKPELLILYGYNCVALEKGMWELSQLTIVESAYNKIRDRLKVSESAVARMLGNTTLVRVEQSVVGAGNVALTYPTGLIELSPKAFNKISNLPYDWYTMHELGHAFDFQGIGGINKSQSFIDKFTNSNCPFNCHDITVKLPIVGKVTIYDSYSPSDIATTSYGNTSAVEDFAETFAITILYNGKHNSFQSQSRIDLMNQLLKNATQFLK